MTNDEAISILDQATQPQNAGKLTRQAYCQVQEALDKVAAIVKALDTPKSE